MSAATLLEVRAEFCVAALTPTEIEDDRFEALCPACPGSITATIGDDGRVELSCTGGCDRARIGDELHLRRSNGNGDGGGNSHDVFVAIHVAPPPTDELLEDIGGFVARFVVLPSKAHRQTLALFVLHTWAIEAAHATPYIVVESPEKQSGKTRLLEVLALLCRMPVKAASITAAALFQTVGAGGKPTLLIDEADAVFGGNSERNEDLRAVLNAGNVPGAPVYRGGKDGKPVQYDVFCPKVLAGIATGKLPDTIRDRAIVLSIGRKLRSERVERLRRRRVQSELDRMLPACAAWAKANREHLAGYECESVEEISDRLEEAWEPLFGIADQAGEAWGTAARRAAVGLAKGDVANQEGDSQHKLLVALQDVFGDREAMFTRDILMALNGDDYFASWRDGKGVGERELGKLLRRYQIGHKPSPLRIGDNVAKGYRREWFQDVWGRYGEPSSRYIRYNGGVEQKTGDFNPSQGGAVCRIENPDIWLCGLDVPDVTDSRLPPRDGSLSDTDPGPCPQCGGLLANVAGRPHCFGCGYDHGEAR